MEDSPWPVQHFGTVFHCSVPVNDPKSPPTGGLYRKSKPESAHWHYDVLEGLPERPALELASLTPDIISMDIIPFYRR
jgi:hypothetical protein